MSFDISGFEKLQKDLQKLEREAPKTCQKISDELAARLLRLVKHETHPGKKPKFDDSLTKEQRKKAEEIWDGYVGGELRRKWTVQKGINTGGTYVNFVINPVEYAPYVEYGHYQQRGRYVPALGKSLSKSWVKGRFMLTKSLIELEKLAPNVIQKNVDAMMKEVFG